jgi:hypothetical protein
MAAMREKIARNRGKVEFVTHAEEVLELLSAGYNIHNVYTMLREKNVITMSYDALCYHLKKMRAENETRPQAKQETPQRNQKQPTEKPKFTRPEDVDYDALF